MQPSRLISQKPAGWRRRPAASTCQRSGATALAHTAATAALADGSSALQDFHHPVSIEQFRQLGYEAIDMVCDYLTLVLPHARVVPDIQPGYLRPLLPASAPVHPEPWAQVKRDFWSLIMPGVTHWQSPHNFAWFSANTSLPGVLAELLGAALNMVGFNWTSGPVSTELEMVVLDWLVQLCGLPDKFMWRHNIWMHVDAAWAGTAAILPEQRHWFAGLDRVDSYSFNPYKWMLTPMGICACWFADSTYLREALSLTPTYLRCDSGSGSGSRSMPVFKDWEIPLGRRFRSLDVWFVLRMYGKESLQAMVRHHIALGQWLAEQVAADSRFELAAPPRFGLTCLRLKGVGCEGNRALLAAVNSAGPSHMVGTDLDGLFTLRVAVGQAHTQMAHVRRLWSLIQHQADKVLLQAAATPVAATAAKTQRDTAKAS